MKKPNSYNELSNVKCKCGKQIKKNLVKRKTTNKPLLCTDCFKTKEAERGHFINDARSKRNTNTILFNRKTNCRPKKV